MAGDIAEEHDTGRSNWSVEDQVLRITEWKPIGEPAPGVTPDPAAVVQAFRDFAGAVTRVTGGSVDVYLSNGSWYLIGQAENYATADKILADPGVQGAFAMLALRGIGLVDDKWLLEPEVVMPFTRQAAAAATA